MPTMIAMILAIFFAANPMMAPRRALPPICNPRLAKSMSTMTAPSRRADKTLVTPEYELPADPYFK